MNLLTICILLSLSIPMQTLSAPPALFPEDKILEQADHAIVGRVLAGRAVYASGLLCGAEYEVVVLEKRKGSLQVGSKVIFGPHVNLKIAGEYDLYLAEDKDGARLKDLMIHALRSTSSLTDQNLLECQRAFTRNMQFVVWQREIDNWPNRIAPGSRK